MRNGFIKVFGEDPRYKHEDNDEQLPYIPYYIPISTITAIFPIYGYLRDKKKTYNKKEYNIYNRAHFITKDSKIISYQVDTLTGTRYYLPFSKSQSNGLERLGLLEDHEQAKVNERGEQEQEQKNSCSYIIH